MNETELLALIQQAKAEAWTELDLRGQYFLNLPRDIRKLQKLEVLKLGQNSLGRLPGWMARLTNLHTLDLSGNSLSKLPDSMAQLTNLHILELSRNNLSELPDSMAQLTNLHNLDFSGNSLSELPDWMAQLTNLHILDLSRNNLSELPDSMAQLTNLHKLDLSENNLSELPDWMADSGNLPRLRNLWIGENPLTTPPAEILGEALKDGFTNADINKIRAYFRQLQEASVTYFYEAKLLIIGEGGAGKTSLARKLVDPNCDLLPEEESTEGIDILHWSFPLPPDQRGDVTDYTVNVWDFGGQEIYFATHQFFLTRRSVYVLVADTRRQHTDFYHWLRMQETFGLESPVLLVKNLNRQHGNDFTIQNEHQLRERFPNLREGIEVDLDEVPTANSWADLLHHLEDYLLNLDHIGQPRPRTWVEVRKAVDRDSRDTIDWSGFVALCREQGMKRDEDIAQLAEYLHNLGNILHFHRDPILRDLVILKPQWGLDAVYKVLDNKQIIKQLGQFSLTDLRSLWNAPRYRGYHLELLRLMENFQLCYPLEDIPDTYIAPQLLTDEVPHYDWDNDENLQMRYAYPLFMPRGILSRAIVKLYKRIEAQRLVWRSGVILADRFARAEMLELRGEGQIRIRVSGNHKRDLLMEIVRALDELHSSFPKLRFERQIPCNCETCLERQRARQEPYFFDFQKVYERAANPRKGTIECGYGPNYYDVSVYDLLNDVAGRGLMDEISRREDRLRGGDIYNVDTGGGMFTMGNLRAGRDVTGRDRIEHKSQVVDSAQLDQLLVSLYILQAAEPVNQYAAVEIIQALKAEALKGTNGDDQAMTELIKRFIGLVPTGVSTVVQAFASPLLSSIAGSATKHVLDEIQRPTYSASLDNV